MSLMDRKVSPNGLRVFASAARHLSFTAAAQELRSTQSAVSQQVRALEEELGVRLFDRVYRGVRLTESGQLLSASVREGFSIMEKTIEQLQQRHRNPRLNILTDFSLASYWLMPRLPAFRRDHPHIDVRIMTNHGEVDWHGQEVDVAIAFCDARTLEARPRLFHEDVFPVCSRGFLDTYGAIEGPARLAEMPLLTLTADQGQGWLDWPGYFECLAGMVYGEPSELIFNNYTLLIQAAIAGQGVALGWQGLVDDLIERDMLVGLEHLRVATSSGYGLIDVDPSDGAPAKRAFLDWVIAHR